MTSDTLPPSGTQSAVGNGEILDNISTVYRWLRILWYYHIKYDINDFSCYCLLYLHGFDDEVWCDLFLFWFKRKLSLSYHKVLPDAGWYSSVNRPGYIVSEAWRTLPAAAMPFQEEITVSWIINENKLEHQILKR